MTRAHEPGLDGKVLFFPHLTSSCLPQSPLMPYLGSIHTLDLAPPSRSRWIGFNKIVIILFRGLFSPNEWMAVHVEFYDGP